MSTPPIECNGPQSDCSRRMQAAGIRRRQISAFPFTKNVGEAGRCRRRAAISARGTLFHSMTRTIWTVGQSKRSDRCRRRRRTARPRRCTAGFASITTRSTIRNCCGCRIGYFGYGSVCCASPPRTTARFALIDDMAIMLRTSPAALDDDDQPSC